MKGSFKRGGQQKIMEDIERRFNAEGTENADNTEWITKNKNVANLATLYF